MRRAAQEHRDALAPLRDVGAREQRGEGPAERLAQDCIKKVECIEYAELGMEAIWRIEVENFPAFIVVDDKGNDFFANI